MDAERPHAHTGGGGKGGGGRGEGGKGDGGGKGRGGRFTRDGRDISTLPGFRVGVRPFKGMVDGKDRGGSSTPEILATSHLA